MTSVARSAVLVIAIGLGWCAVGVIAGAAAKPLSGVVRNVMDRSPVTATEVRIDVDHFDTTTDSGSFAIPWSPPLAAGYPFTFNVKEWVVVDPCVLAPGRTYLPAPEAEAISITAVRRGDIAAIRRVIGCVIEQNAARFKPTASGAKPSNSPTSRTRGSLFEHRGDLTADPTLNTPVFRALRFTLPPLALRARGTVDGGQPPAGDGDVIAEQAAQLGLTRDQLATAIDAWSAEVEDPYYRGLAAFN